MLSAKELLTKCKSFDLPELVNHLLVKKDPVVANAIASRDYEEERNVANYYASSQQLLKVLHLSVKINLKNIIAKSKIIFKKVTALDNGRLYVHISNRQRLTMPSTGLSDHLHRR